MDCGVITFTFLIYYSSSTKEEEQYINLKEEDWLGNNKGYRSIQEAGDLNIAI